MSLSGSAGETGHTWRQYFEERLTQDLFTKEWAEIKEATSNNGVCDHIADGTCGPEVGTGERRCNYGNLEIKKVGRNSCLTEA